MADSLDEAGLIGDSGPEGRLLAFPVVVLDSPGVKLRVCSLLVPFSSEGDGESVAATQRCLDVRSVGGVLLIEVGEIDYYENRATMPGYHLWLGVGAGRVTDERAQFGASLR